MVEGDPDDDLAHFRLGQALMEDGQFDEAIKAFERTLELSPGFSRVRMGRPEAAEEPA